MPSERLAAKQAVQGGDLLVQADLSGAAHAYLPKDARLFVLPHVDFGRTQEPSRELRRVGVSRVGADREARLKERLRFVPLTTRPGDYTKGMPRVRSGVGVAGLLRKIESLPGQTFGLVELESGP